MNRGFFAKLAIVLTASLLIGLIYHCKNPKTESDYYSPEILATHFNGENFVGSESCKKCHPDIYKSHVKTPHYNTSALANKDNVLGSFVPESNILDLDHVKFTMEQKGDSMYQFTEFKNRTANKPPSTFDIVIGSGTRGQSYATWEDDKLFQLQTSYYTPSDSWVNSPGFPTYADKARPIRGACLKCHVTFAANNPLSPQGNRYDKTKIIFGVDCERCHRPAEKHVVYHQKNPEVKTAKFMLAFDSLPRQKRLDVCAQCHSGPPDRILKGSSFSFLAGEVLDEYVQNSKQEKFGEKLDVHGNQYGLLTQSKCFNQTATMDCTTCHDPHKNQRGNTSYFNQKCMECHESNSTVCSAKTSERQEMGNNCIACHMPVTPSETMTVQLAPADSVETSFYIRTHLIDIYTEKVWTK